jgi:hypothetical protein
MEQELWLGPSHRGSVFRSHEELEQAWLTHRDRLMERYGSHGRRPQIWWEFEGAALGLERNYDTERSTLYEHGLLGEEERAELVTYWRREFEKAYILKDAQARRRHFAWADIPRSLRKEWRLQRPRRRLGRTIHEHEEAATSPEPAA